MSTLSEIISYLVVLGASLYGLLEYAKNPQTIPFLLGTLLTTGSYALFGLMKHGICGESIMSCDEAKECNEKSRFFIPVLSLPCLASEIWYKNHSVGLGWAHFCVGLGLLTLKYRDSLTQETVDLTAGVTTLSIIGAAFAFEEYYALLSGLAFIMAHYGSQRHELDSIHLPPEELYNYCVAGYALCAGLSSCQGF